MGFRDRLSHAWNVFTGWEEQTRGESWGTSYASRPDRARSGTFNDKTIIGSIYTRIAIDVAANKIQHVKLDEDGRYSETVKSGLNYCLNTEANTDQASRAFLQDIVLTLFENGDVAVVPIDTTLSPDISQGWDINTMRVGRIVQWYPDKIRVNAYDERDGTRKDIIVPKNFAAIVENPLYAVMNEPNGTLQRLLRKLALLDAVDEASGSGKLDIIIQLPYVIKSQAKQEQAEKRAKDIEMQLKGSKYGIAYTDGTERITQLNRPAENNLLKQVEFLTQMLYAQLGISEQVFLGTADEKTMLNYHNRTIDPIIMALLQAMRRTFLTKTARTQGHSIEYFRDPFKLVALSDLAEIADKFTRNEILTSNEVRSFIGMKPSKDKEADQLRNKNLPEAVPEGEPKGQGPPPPSAPPVQDEPTSEPTEK